jgi:hypothetical protein
MCLAAAVGAWLDLEAKGSDAGQALVALCGLINARFHEGGHVASPARDNAPRDAGGERMGEVSV